MLSNHEHGGNAAGAGSPGQTGTTSGGVERAQHTVAGPALAFDLGAEQAALRHEHGWVAGGHVAKTIVKEHHLSVVLIALQAGAALHEHVAQGPVTIHCLSGSVRIGVAGQDQVLTAGHLLVLDGGVRHSVTADRESNVLLTVAM
jgi:quercetin dioxygenase-like cupin family protein